MLIESAGVGVQWRGPGGRNTRTGSLPRLDRATAAVRNGVRQGATLIMSDRLGRLHKIIITQQWSESPQWHFHTTSDLWGNL
ncbi:hypothetical protein EYF80_009413 [Liparis tanakae]|uniref:Uncharacterized protein n=1 Tax=Liparis tanakae TaxID=230148 RepID=A0A4Z2IQY7_9TELE|nr:hypothetical protein EYF80_009413 [Liparis tanakae]